jgi:hypothetical protein
MGAETKWQMRDIEKKMCQIAHNLDSIAQQNKLQKHCASLLDKEKGEVECNSKIPNN